MPVYPGALRTRLTPHLGRELNFGDCLTYAIAQVEREPLLCVGDDFARADVALAVTAA